jgi:hypothetical protein
MFLSSKLNVTTSRRLKLDSWQKQEHKTDSLTPDSRRTQIPPDVIIASFALLPECPVSELNYIFLHDTNASWL